MNIQDFSNIKPCMQQKEVGFGMTSMVGFCAMFNNTDTDF